MGEVLTGPDLVAIIRELQSQIAELQRRSARLGGASGVAVDSWSGASITSDGVVVAHGLGVTPSEVFTQSTTIVAHARPTAVDDTSFVVNLRTIDGSVPAAGPVTVYWRAEP